MSYYYYHYFFNELNSLYCIFDDHTLSGKNKLSTSIMIKKHA